MFCTLMRVVDAVHRRCCSCRLDRPWCGVPPRTVRRCARRCATMRRSSHRRTTTLMSEALLSRQAGRSLLSRFLHFPLGRAHEKKVPQSKGLLHREACFLRDSRFLPLVVSLPGIKRQDGSAQRAGVLSALPFLPKPHCFTLWDIPEVHRGTGMFYFILRTRGWSDNPQNRHSGNTGRCSSFSPFDGWETLCAEFPPLLDGWETLCAE